MEFYGDKFKRIKKIKKITSTKFAELLGTTRQTIYAWENGLSTPKQSDILQICKILNIETEDISDIKRSGELERYERAKEQKRLIDDEKDLRELINSNRLSEKQCAALVNLTSGYTKLKNIQKHYRYQLRSYGQILNNIDQIVYVKDRDHKYVYVNDSFLSITGTEIFKDDIKNISYTRIFDTADYYELLKLERQAFHNGEPVNNQRILIPNTDGKLIGLVNITPAYSENNNEVTDIIVTIKDITKLSYAAERQEQLKDAINSMDEYVFIRPASDPYDRYIFLSDSVEKVYGYSAEDFYDDPTLWYKSIFKEDKKRLKIKKNSRYLPPGEWIYRIIRKDGAVRWVNNRISQKTGINGVEIIFGRVADITEGYEVQKDREELQQAVNLSNIVIWVGDTTLMKSPDDSLPLTFISSNVYEHLGITKEEFLEDSSVWLNIVYKDDYEKVLAFREVQDYPKQLSFRIKTAGKNLKWVNLKIDRKGHMIYGVIRDYTQAKKSEQELIELQAAIDYSETLIVVDKEVNENGIIYHQYGYIGDKVKSFFGVSKQDMMENHYAWLECILEEDRERVADSYRNKMGDSDLTIRNEYRVKAVDGSIKWLKHKSVFRGKSIYSYIDDITEEKLGS